MPRYFLHLSYEGTNYRGWQIQKQVKSVQEVLCTALTRILHQRIHVQGCGRTDAGVHASQYFGHFDTIDVLSDSFLFVVNKVLPDDIVIHEVIPVNDRSNAQLHAVSRQYTYVISEVFNPFMRNRCWQLPNHSALDIAAMADAVHTLTLTEDFRAMCRQPDSYPHTICNIMHADLDTSTQGMISITIEGNRFLKSMVRLIVKRVVDIGLGKLSLGKYKEHLLSGEPYQPMSLAPPQGLYLSRVQYRHLRREPIIKIR